MHVCVCVCNHTSGLPKSFPKMQRNKSHKNSFVCCGEFEVSQPFQVLACLTIFQGHGPGHRFIETLQYIYIEIYECEALIGTRISAGKPTTMGMEATQNRIEANSGRTDSERQVDSGRTADCGQTADRQRTAGGQTADDRRTDRGRRANGVLSTDTHIQKTIYIYIYMGMCHSGSPQEI